MKLTENEWLRDAGRQMSRNLVAVALMAMGLLGMPLVQVASAQAVSTTTVQGTVYLANGQASSGTLHLSWPAFTTANGQAVAADSMTVTIAPDGFVSVNLAPNLGATPAGLYYTAVFYMSDGTTSTQYWVVPSAAQASIAQVQSQLMPAAQAVQAVSKAYVDQSISELSQSGLTASGGTLTGPLYLSADPTQALQASDKHYVDTAVSQAVPLAGGNMTGPLSTPAVNGVQAPAASSSQTTLQAAMTAAGTSGAIEIPPTYAGTDGFTNPNGVRVTDLRTSGAQQAERSVKEFGAVCDGVTDDTNALQTALNYAQTHGVALTIPQGTCKTRSLNWHGESIGGMGKQVSALMGFPGQDVLASVTDSANLLGSTRIHDLAIYVDQSVDVSCSPANGLALAGSCAVNRPLENNSIFSRGGNGLIGTEGTGAGWAVGNCAIAMPAVTGTGGNGLRVAVIENAEIATTGVDPMAAQYAGARSTHTCGLYMAQWPQWSEFRNIDIRGLNTGIAIPALPGATPAGLNADSNRWQNITIQATHGFTAAAGSNNVLDNVVAMAGNSAATGEPPTGLVLDLAGTQQGWTVRNAVVMPSWNAVQPQLTITASGGAVTGVTVGSEHGLGFDPYGTQVPLQFSGSCTAQATANVNSDGSIGTISVTQGGTGCSATTTASVNVAGTWDTAAPVNLIGGQSMTFFAGNLLKGNGGYTVWNAVGSESYGTQLDGGGGTLPGGGAYAALVANNAGTGRVSIGSDGASASTVATIDNAGNAQFNGALQVGGSSSLYASFTGTTSIQFPGLAAGSGHNCLQVDNSGYVTNTGSACGSGSGSGTVGSATSGQIAYYPGNGTSVSGMTTVPLSAGGTGSGTAAAALQNLGGISSTTTSQQTMSGPLSVPSLTAVNSETSNTPAIDVRSFGAVGDCLTDDTAAIQSAINAGSCSLHNVYAPATAVGKCYKVSTLYFNYDATHNPGFCNPVSSGFTQGGGFTFYGDGNSVHSGSSGYGTYFVSTSSTVPAIQMLYGVTYNGNTSTWPWQYSNMGLRDINVYAANSSAVIWWQANGSSSLRRITVTQGGSGHGVVCENCYSGDQIDQVMVASTNATPVSGSKGLWVYNDLGGGGGTISINDIVSGGGFDTCVEIGPANLSGTNGGGVIDSIRASNLDGEHCNTGIMLNGVYGMELSGWHTERNANIGMDITGGTQGVSIHGGEAQDCCNELAQLQIEGASGNVNTGIHIAGNKFSLLSFSSQLSNWVPGINIVNSTYSAGTIQGNTFQPAPYSTGNWGLGIKTNGTGQNWSVFNNSSASIVSTTSPYPTINLGAFIDSSTSLDFFIDPATDYVHIPNLVIPALDATGAGFTIGQNGSSNYILFPQAVAFGSGSQAGPGGGSIGINSYTGIIQAEYSPTAPGLGIGFQYGYFYHVQAQTDLSVGGSQVLTGVHGTSGAKVQASDGTGTAGDCVKYASDGSVTDAGAPCGTVTSTNTGTSLSNPSAPSVSTAGTAGSTSYSYVAVGLGANGYVNHTAASPAGSISAGNATLSGTNYNVVVLPSVTSAASCDLYRSVGTATQGAGKIWNGVCGSTVNDTGYYADGQTAPVSNTSSTNIVYGDVLTPASGDARNGSTGETIGQKLRRLLTQNFSNNPQVDPWLVLPPAWQSSHTYTAPGNLVTNGGNVYINQSYSCTSAGSGGPTGAGAAPITDNSCTWYYLTTTPTASAIPGKTIPLFTISGSNPGGLTNTYTTLAQFQSNTLFLGGPVSGAVSGTGVQYGFCAFAQTQAPGSSAGPGRSCYQYSGQTFMTDAPKFYIEVESPGNCAVTIAVDGQYINPGGLIVAAGYPVYLIVDYSSVAAGTTVRKVSYETACGSGESVYAIGVATTHKIWKPSPSDYANVCVLGSSLEISGNGFPSLPNDDWPGIVGKMFGWNVWNGGQGGTGYIATNGGNGYSYVQHVNDCLNYNPDLIIIGGAYNDSGSTQANITAAAETLFTTIRTALPTVPIIVSGTLGGNTGPSTAIQNTESAVSAAVTAKNDPLIFFIPVSSDPAGAWFNGTGTVSVTTGTGNADAYINPAGTHPTDAGIFYEAQKYANAIKAAIQQIP